jgi:diguanylate cyclase (GGDEF)-like protein
MVRSRRLTRHRHSSDSGRLQLARRALWIVLAGSIAGFTVLMGPSMDAGRLLRDLVFYNLPYLATASLCWWAPANTRSSRRVWRLLAAAILLATAGNICFTLIPDAHGVVAPTIRDDLYLACHAVATIALVLLIRDRRPRAALTVWLDRLVIGLGSAAVAAALVPTPLLLPFEPPMSTHAITHLAHPATYPLVDLTLLIVLATVGGITRSRVEPRLALLALGLGITLLTDLAYLRLDPAGHSDHGNPVDLGRLLALVPLAAAANLGGTTPRPHRVAVEATEHAATTPPTVAALAALTVLMAGNHIALPLAASELAGACLLAALLRAALTLRQLRALPEARREARTDPLTDLANRRHLHERCAHLLARPEAAPVTVLMIDLNGFKKVNDRHGHHIGDALLVQVAIRLAAVLRRDDLLGRLGGDEFAALLPTTTTNQAHRIAQRMHAALAEPITVDAHTYSIGASIGISSITPHGSPPTALFHNADIAMYHAKTSRTGTAIAYRTDHTAHIHQLADHPTRHHNNHTTRHAHSRTRHSPQSGIRASSWTA